MSALQPIDRSALNPLALDLGLAAGVLSPTGADQVTVNDDWFQDPLGNAAVGLRTNGQDLAALLGAILGEVEGNALAIPAQDPSGLGTWYPTQNCRIGRRSRSSYPNASGSGKRGRLG